MSNQVLYESDEVVSKYASLSTRNRCLNNAEKLFIDSYDIKNKNILVLGSGTGRVPSNLLLFGNHITGLELSNKLFNLSNRLFPEKDFKRLKFVRGNAINLEMFEDNSFDVVFFPQNGIDYIENIKDRYAAIKEMARVCVVEGIVSYSSLNITSYCLSYKLPWHQKNVRNITKKYIFREEYVIGGGFRYMSKPKYLIEETLKIADLQYIGFTADVRNGLDFRLAKSLKWSSFVFPWLNYVFKKIN